MTPTLAVAVLFYNESRYLKEFIAFHQIVGVSRFYLFNDQSTDDYLVTLRPFREQGTVKLIHFPLIHGRVQTDAYTHAIQIARRDGDVDLLAVIDVDEFLHSPSHDTIQEAIETLPLPNSWSALSVPWRCFGDSGHAVYSSEPVTKRFTWRPADNSFHNQWSKSILNLKVDHEIKVIPGDPHIFHAQYGTFDEYGQRVTCPRENHFADLLRVNHYFTKSREEWEQRHPVDRPILGGIYPRDESRFHSVQDKAINDTSLWDRFGPELERRLA